MITYHGKRDVWVLRPDIPLREQAPEIRAPRIPRPTQNLLQEAPIWLHSTEKLCLLAALDVRKPAMADHPPCQELVVPRVELVLAQPVVMCEAVQELGVLENDGAIRGSAP